MYRKQNGSDDVISLIDLPAGLGDYRGRRALFSVDHDVICRERDVRLGLIVAEQDFDELMPVHDALSLSVMVQRGELPPRKRVRGANAAARYGTGSAFFEFTERAERRRDVSSTPNVEKTCMKRGQPPS